MNQIESKVGLEEANVLTKEEWKTGVKKLQVFILESRDWAMRGISNDVPAGRSAEVAALRTSFQSKTPQTNTWQTPQNAQFNSMKTQALGAGISYRSNGFGR
jgi:hypothetical protein